MDLFQKLLRTSAQTAWVHVRSDGVVARVNPAFARHTGVPPERLVGHVLFDFVTTPERERIQAWAQGGPLPGEPTWINFTARGGDPFTLRCVVGRTEDGLQIVGEPELDHERSTSEELVRLNNELATMARERARRQRELERVRGELEAALEELRTSYWHLRKIQEVIPICMECGKVKAGEALWQTLIGYLKENDIFVSHGYCPDCERAKLVEFGLE